MSTISQEWLVFTQDYYKWFITAFVLVFYPMLRRIPGKVFLRSMKSGISPHRKQRARLLLNTITSIILICLLLMLWGIELRGLLVVGSSMFALLGVALFAGWSLLSNLTSFLILFTQNDCRVGRWVRVVDGANFLEGEITEMGFMNVQLRSLDGDLVLYPNNLFMTRPVIVLKEKPQPKDTEASEVEVTLEQNNVSAVESKVTDQKVKL
ncbi:mechanosensitive ion channel domain-containing protein [Vibrio algivorus]|uniref:Small-conductance mechanosensitive channel n=1 Tax=Vibrio algivorus TaxID=1667024 RepID=A0A557PD23_9VIBR|nr:mechanosensitive ion channel domain-containing protein [Vibrio algivorus]TVO38562.1 mechanosensitive ion channel [Vibrio algivorus]GLT15129.1 mechanosensitive ion channel protein [Vibrio algivorus]